MLYQKWGQLKLNVQASEQRSSNATSRNLQEKQTPKGKSCLRKRDGRWKMVSWFKFSLRRGGMWVMNEFGFKYLSWEYWRRRQWSVWCHVPAPLCRLKISMAGDEQDKREWKNQPFPFPHHALAIKKFNTMVSHKWGSWVEHLNSQKHNKEEDMETNLDFSFGRPCSSSPLHKTATASADHESFQLTIQ